LLLKSVDRALDNGCVTETRRPDHLLSTDGKTGIYALSPDGSRIADVDRPWEPPPDGSQIKLMGEDTVAIPLWSRQDGLMFNDAEELVRDFDVSTTLAADIEAWAAAWRTAWRTPLDQARLDSEASSLIRRLNLELDLRYDFVYQP
ncbi:MAG TPA: hypothetical protein VHZ06_03260, partial [Marmoricola sp.]|nr:hypothetical protein [Marmoricola sp.]